MSELNIPGSWAETKLEIAGTWGSGGTPLKSKKEFYGGEINWLKTGDLNNGFVREVPDRITKLGLDNIGGKLYPPQTVIMAMYGATIGKLGILDIEVAVNQACACCTTFEEVYYKYLFYWLMNYRKEYMALGQGGAQPNISRSLIYEQPFAIPPRQEQERIVQKIESCFSKIEDTEQSLNKVEILLEKYRESLLAKAFRGELILQNPDDEPASVLLAKIREERSQNQKGKKKEQEFVPISDDEKPFDIPESWEWVRLGELCSKVGSGKTPKGGDSTYTETGIPLIRSQNVYNSKLILENVAFIDKTVHQQMKNTEVMSLDVLLNITGGSIGRSCVVPKKWETGNVNQHVCIIRPALGEEYLSPYITLYLQSIFGQKLVRDNQKGAAREAINMEQINNFLIPLPPYFHIQSILMKIEQYIAQFSSLQESLAKKSKLTKLMRESTLMKAFEGRLVEQVESEGTGHELLQKILEQKNQEKSAKESTKNKVTKKVSKKKTTKK